MTIRHAVAVGALLCVGALFAGQSQAAIVTWDALGNVNGGGTFDNSAGLLGSVAPGQEFHFTFSFDDAEAQSPPGSGLYPRSYTADLTVASASFSQHFDSAGNASSFVVNAGGFDSLTVNANDPDKSAILALFNTTGGPLSSNALPSLIQANQFANKLFTFAIANSAPALDGFTGTITGINPVPLPAAAWLLLSGLGSLAMVSRRRFRRSADITAKA